MKIAVDTNVLVRYLTWDDEGLAIEAANAIEAADAIVVPTIVLCELVWVLKRAYRYAGQEIIDILRRLVAIRAVEVERPAAEAGLAMLARGGDFADGVVRYEADRAKCDRLVTFDQDFARLLDPGRVALLGAPLLADQSSPNANDHDCSAPSVRTGIYPARRYCTASSRRNR